MAKCWTPLPLLCAFMTLLIEWRVFERIKILLLGESFNCGLHFTFHQFTLSPEVGLFGTDVTTDWVNGANLIISGDVIWGICMVALPFLPAAIVGLIGISVYLAKKAWCRALLSAIIYVPFVLIGTPAYMLFVLVSGCYKVVKPDIEFTLEGNYDSEVDTVDKMFAEISPLLRMGEVAAESYPQSVLGEQSVPSVLIIDLY